MPFTIDGTTGFNLPEDANLTVNDGNLTITSTAGSGGRYLKLDNTDTGGRQYAMISTNDSHGSLGGGDFAILDVDAGGNDANQTRFLIDSSGSVKLHHSSTEILATTANGIDVTGVGSNFKSATYNILNLQTDTNDDGTSDDGIFKITNGSAGTTKAEFRWDESEDAVQIAYGDHGRHIVIKSSGNVGIGQTNPDARLDLGTLNSATAGQDQTLQMGAFGFRHQDTGGFNRLYLERNYGGWQTTPVLTARADGNIGINTSDPSDILTINQGGASKYIRMEGPSSGDIAGGLQLFRGSTLRASFYANPTHNLTILSETGINFRSNGGERFRVDHAQANMVHVQGDTADHTGTGGGSKGFSLATAGGTSCPLYFGTETNSAQKSMYMNGYWIYIRGHQNEGVRFVFSQGGGTAIRSDQYQFKYNSATRPTGNTTWDGFSDSRAKENVQTLTNALDTIGQLRPVTFDWTDDYADRMNMFEMDTTDAQTYNHFSVKENGYDLDRKTAQIGFIAQEFETVFPKSITEQELELGDTTIQDFKTVNYDHLIPTLTKAIQELKAENDALRARLDAAGL